MDFIVNKKIDSMKYLCGVVTMLLGYYALSNNFDVEPFSQDHLVLGVSCALILVSGAFFMSYISE